MAFSKKDLFADALLLIVLGAIALALFTFMRPSLGKIWRALHLPTFNTEAVPAGTPADYAWDVQSLEGKTIPASVFKGKVVFLNFWATWCGPCKLELPSIEKLYGQFKDKEVVFLLVSNEEPAAIRNFLEKKPLKAPVYTIQKTPEFFNVRGLPTTFILSRSGTVAHSHIGAKMWDKKPTVELLEKLLAEGNGGVTQNGGMTRSVSER